MCDHVEQRILYNDVAEKKEDVSCFRSKQKTAKPSISFRFTTLSILLVSKNRLKTVV